MPTESKTMSKTMSKNTAIVLSDDELKGEQLALALAKAGMSDSIEAALIQLGLAISADEHEAARPKSAKEQAMALAASLGVDLKAKPASKLAADFDGIAKAFGKYSKHCFAADSENGTSLVTNSVCRQLVETGKASLAKTLDDVRKCLPTYSSAGHYNTLKRMLKEAGFTVHVQQGSFSLGK